MMLRMTWSVRVGNAFFQDNGNEKTTYAQDKKKAVQTYGAHTEESI